MNSDYVFLCGVIGAVMDNKKPAENSSGLPSRAIRISARLLGVCLRKERLY